MTVLTLSEIFDHFAHVVFDVTIPALVTWFLVMAREWLTTWLHRITGRSP